MTDNNEIEVKAPEVAESDNAAELHEEANPFAESQIDNIKDEKDETDESEEWLSSRSEIENLEEEIEESQDDEAELATSDDFKSDFITEGIEKTKFGRAFTRGLDYRKLANPDNLKEQLNGKVKFSFDDLKESFLLDWTNSKLKISQADIQDNADCTLNMSSIDFQNFLSGKLNPQLGMLTDRIKVQGKANLAVYVFNLFRSR